MHVDGIYLKQIYFSPHDDKYYFVLIEKKTENDKSKQTLIFSTHKIDGKMFAAS